MENSEGQKVKVCSGASGLTCSVTVRDGHAPAAGGQGAQRPTWHLSRKHMGCWSYIEQLSSAPRNRNFPSVLWPKAGPYPTGKSFGKVVCSENGWVFVAQGGRAGKNDFEKRCFFRSFGGQACPTSRTPASRQLPVLFFALPTQRHHQSIPPGRPLKEV